MGGQMSCTSPQSDSDRDHLAEPRSKPQAAPRTSGSGSGSTASASATRKEQNYASQQYHNTSQSHKHHSNHEPSTSQQSQTYSQSQSYTQQPSAQLALQSHAQPASSTTATITHPLRASNSYQALGPMVYVSCATSRIGIATIRGLRLNFPNIKIRAGVKMNENKAEVARMFREAHLDDIDCVQVDPRKRQSLIWALVGVQALLVIPSADSNVRTALAHVQAAKTAGVALVTVVTIPSDHAPASTSTNGKKSAEIPSSNSASVPHVVERYTLKTKLGCCFMRLPEELVDDIIFPPSSASSPPLTSPAPVEQSAAPKFHLSDVGTACATILANHQQHLFTRYDLQAADADNKRKYEAAHPPQEHDSAPSSNCSSPDSETLRMNGAGGRRGSTASTVTDVSDHSGQSSPEHSHNHSHSHSHSHSASSSANNSPIQAH